MIGGGSVEAEENFEIYDAQLDTFITDQFNFQNNLRIDNYTMVMLTSSFVTFVGGESIENDEPAIIQYMDFTEYFRLSKISTPCITTYPMTCTDFYFGQWTTIDSYIYSDTDVVYFETYAVEYVGGYGFGIRFDSSQLPDILQYDFVRFFNYSWIDVDDPDDDWPFDIRFDLADISANTGFDQGKDFHYYLYMKYRNDMMLGWGDVKYSYFVWVK